MLEETNHTGWHVALHAKEAVAGELSSAEISTYRMVLNSGVSWNFSVEVLPLPPSSVPTLCILRSPISALTSGHVVVTGLKMSMSRSSELDSRCFFGGPRTARWIMKKMGWKTVDAIFVSHPQGSRGLRLGISSSSGSKFRSDARPVFQCTTRKHQPFLWSTKGHTLEYRILLTSSAFSKMSDLKSALDLATEAPLARKGTWYSWQSTISEKTASQVRRPCARFFYIELWSAGRLDDHRFTCHLDILVAWLTYWFACWFGAGPETRGHFSRDWVWNRLSMYSLKNGESEIKLSGISNSVPAEWQHPLWVIA